MGKTNKGYYKLRDAEMRTRWDAGECLQEIMLFSGLQIQRTCQILDIKYTRDVRKNGDYCKPRPVVKPVTRKDYWVTCDKCNRAGRYRDKPDRCWHCKAKLKDETIEPIEGETFRSKYR